MGVLQGRLVSNKNLAKGLLTGTRKICNSGKIIPSETKIFRSSSLQGTTGPGGRQRGGFFLYIGLVLRGLF